MGIKLGSIIGITAVLIVFNLFMLLYVQDNQLKRIEVFRNELVKIRRDFSTHQEEKEKEKEKRGKDTDQHRRFQQEVRRVVESLPYVFTFTEYAGMITEMLEKHSLVTEKGLLFSPATSERLGLTKYATHILAKGRYSDMKAFISKLPTFPELLCLEQLRFERSEEGRNEIELNLGISIYFKGHTDG